MYLGSPTRDVCKSIPGNNGILAIEVQVEQSTLPVTVTELIGNVPAKRTKLFALLKYI